MPEIQNLALNMIRLRSSRDWSQVDLEAHSGVGLSAIKMAETQKSFPRLHNLHAIAVALGTTVSEILSDPQGDFKDHLDQVMEIRRFADRLKDKSAETLSKLDRDLVALLLNMNPSEQRRLVDRIRARRGDDRGQKASRKQRD